MLTALAALSCGKIFDPEEELKHLDEKQYKGRDFTVTWYRTSSITTVHDHVELSRWKYTDEIMECNEGNIYDIAIANDTITIRATTGILIYDLEAIKNGCYIKVDSTVTDYEYMKKFQPENAKYYLQDTIRKN